MRTRYILGSSSNSILQHFLRISREDRSFIANPFRIRPLQNAECLSSGFLQSTRRKFVDLLHLRDTVVHCKRVHAQIMVSGIGEDVLICNLILRFLGKCEGYGGLEYARLVFDKMPERNLVSWATMISVYNGFGLSGDVFHVFVECLRRLDESVNEFVLAGVIRACAQLDGVYQGGQLHGFVVKSGFLQDVYVGSAVTGFYSKKGCIDQVGMVFDELKEKTSASWTAILSGYVRCGEGFKALDLFYHMCKTDILPDRYVLSSVLSACSALELLEGGKQVHCYGIRRGIDSDSSVTNVLIDVYTKCGRVDKGRKLFDQMAVKDLVSWTTMISGYMQNSYDTEAMNLLADMVKSSWNPDTFACSSVLNSCGSIEAIEQGKQVHAYALKANLEGDRFVANGLIDMYSKCGSLIDSRRVFEEMPNHDIVAYGAMIEGYSRSVKLTEAADLFHEMRLKSFTPSNLTFVSILGVSASLSNFVLSKQVHGLMIKFGISRDILAATSLIDVYSKCAGLKEARLIFDGVNYRDQTVWNAMMFGYTQQLKGEEALSFFKEFQTSDQTPDTFSFAAAVTAASNLASLRHGQQFHGQVLQFGFDNNPYVSNALVDMYAKCGSIEDACKIFDYTRRRDAVMWISMISKYAHHGHADKSLEMFRKMIDAGIKPNYSTFLAVLSACSHLGLLEDGSKHFNAMTGFGIEPGTEHYACMVSLLGRAGKLQEAYDFIQQIPRKPAAIVWRSLLSACWAAGNTELGRHAAEMAIESDPNDSASYVLLSNILAAEGKWADVKKVRKWMESSGTVKEAGSCFHC